MKMPFDVKTAKRVIAVRNLSSFEKVGKLCMKLHSGDLVFFLPDLDDPQCAYKGMRKPQLFAKRTAPRDKLRSWWENAWMHYQEREMYPDPFSKIYEGVQKKVLDGYDIDHVFPVCWAAKKQFEYVLLEPVPLSANRSAGGGIEKTAAQTKNAELLQKYVDIDIFNDCAYLTAASISKLLGVSSGRSADGYPGLAHIIEDIKILQALLAY